MNRFITRLADILDIAPNVLSPDTPFRTVCDWDSLKGFGILVMLENDYAHAVNADDFCKLNTVRDLASAAGIED